VATGQQRQEDVENRIKAPISVFQGTVGRIANNILNWCNRHAAAGHQPTQDMAAYVEWILSNAGIPNVETFTMESFTTDEWSPGKKETEDNYTYYCITPNYLKYSTDQPQAAVPSKTTHIVQWVHCTTPDGPISILRHRAVKAANAHNEEEYGCFFAKMH
jgi:hypothetical protein